MKANKEISHTPKELLGELKALVSEAQTLMTSSLSEHSSSAVGDLRNRIEATEERFTEIYDDAKKKVVAGTKSANSAIREHPYQSLAIGLAVGLVAGLLLDRRSH